MRRHLIPLFLIAAHAKRVGKWLAPIKKQSNALPLALLVGGGLGALYCAYQAFEMFIRGDLAGESPILFACFCLVAVIGWQELRATQFHESNESGDF